MSALAGILNLGSGVAPVNEYDLAKLGATLDSRGPDGGFDVANGNVGMSYRAYHTNRESRLEVQPLVTREGHMLTWNGRLDNRDDLIRQLRANLPHTETITDLTILMAAYLKWEKDCFSRLVGDFCLALWDNRLRVLYLVRDVAGARALKYHLDRDRIVWSTETDALLALQNRAWELDEEYIAAAMSLGPIPGRTPYKNILSVKPAHVLSVKATGEVRSERFWRLDPYKVIRYSTDEQYQEHALEQFSDAIRCRLRSDSPVFAELSGGLDSSAIVCLADRLIKNREAQAPGLETVSHVFDECPTSDERRYIQLVEAKRQIRGHHIKDEDFRLLAPLPHDIAIVTPNPVVLSFGLHSGISKAMERAGSRVLLSGLGGDQMFGGVYGAYPEVADLLAAGKFLTLHQRLRAWSKARKRSYVSLLWKDAVVRQFPQRVQAITAGQVAQLPPWYNGDFARRMKLRERMLAKERLRSFPTHSSRDQAHGFLSAVKSISSCWRTEQFGIEVSYPFAHRPLVEFLQAIPLDQLMRPGENRVVMRRMLAGILPDEVATRRTKGNPAEAIFRAIARESERLCLVFEDSRLAARGYIDKEPLLAALDRARHGYEIYSAFLVQTMSLEFWLRDLETRDSLTRCPAVEPRRSSWAHAAEPVTPAV
ncbi:MAG TPA: asparagine synthase-related protein [Pyrinomonadaceae bacterium]|nr:asparagine synthase-related protein [Pyrinomonadaceae bacterium]